jgi:hypothetical protein
MTRLFRSFEFDGLFPGDTDLEIKGARVSDRISYKLKAQPNALISNGGSITEG